MADFLRGKGSSRKLPAQVSVFLLGSEAHWDFKDIKNMSVKEFDIYSKLARTYYNLANKNNQVKL